MTAYRSAFDRLRSLLHGISPPPGFEPVPLHLGESRLGVPDIDVGPLTSIDGWTRYPPLGGTGELREAYLYWLQRRFDVRQSLHDGRVAVEPTPGSKQAVAVAIALAVAGTRADAVAGTRRGGPAVVLPNPFYPTYLVGTEAARAEPALYTLDDGGDVSPLAEAVRGAGGRVAAIVVCSPGNPRGEILSPRALREVSAIAADTDAVLIVDECYTDLCVGRVPAGYLSLVERGAVGAARFLVLHSLSKRSAAPGLRSGFVAGDPATVAAYAQYNRHCGVATPIPVCGVAAALWSDDAHVSRLRSLLARNWDLADALLGGLPRYRRAEAGLFLWLPVDDDETTARELWRQRGVSVMPGRYLSVAGPDGVNPGAGHLRVSLGLDEALMRRALTQLRDGLAEPARGR